GVVELAVVEPRAVREIGVAWRAGPGGTAPVEAFKRFVLARRGRLLSG
ncbi:LysR family transcriptional regulator, partial [Streptomyces sp. DJ]